MASTKNGIIYPDNYDKVADVPADMKALAESVDENIERINKNLDKNADELKNLQKDNTGNKTAIEAINKKNTEQDTNIQKNAKDIEANQNNIKALQVENAEVKAENERLKSDIESISLVGEANGESIDLNDSSNARFNKFEIGGNHKQETRKGYNLLDFNVTQNGRVTVNEDGTIIINGTGGFTLAFKQFTAKANTKYYIKWELVSGTVDTSKSNGNSFLSPLDNTNIKQSEFKENVVENDKNINGFWVNNMTVFTNAVIKFWANTNKSDFEQYGASPSPDYPSEIKTVKDSAEVKVVNKNLLYYTNKNQTIKGIDYTINQDKSIKVKGTATEYADFYLCGEADQYINIGLVGTFKLSGCNSGNSSKYMLYVVKKDKFGNLEYYQNIKGDTTFTISKGDTLRIFIRVLTGVTVDDVIYPMLRVSTDTDSSYTEAKEQTITMPVQQEMLEKDYISDIEHHEWGKLILNGEENWIYDSIYKYFRCPSYTFDRGIPDGSKKGLEAQKSNYFEITADWETTFRDNINKNIMYGVSDAGYKICIRNVNCATVEEFKACLKSKYDEGNPVIVYYKLAEPIDLELTSEQKVVAKQIKETLHTYKNVTHIYSDDEVSSIVNVEYAKDLNTTISNIQALVLNNASEEV